MATELKLGTLVDGKRVATIDSTGTIFDIPDDTGAYDAVSNTGGYGAPNPERTDYGLFMFAFYRSSDGTDDSEFTLANNDPNSVSTVRVTAVKDGHIEVTGILVLKVVASPNEGDYRYNGGSQLQKYTNSAWVDVTDSDELLTAPSSANLIKDVLNIPVVTFINRAYYDVLKELYEGIIPGEKCANYEVLQDRKNELKDRMTSALYNFNAGNYNQFQLIMEGLIKYVANYQS